MVFPGSADRNKANPMGSSLKKERVWWMPPDQCRSRAIRSAEEQTCGERWHAKRCALWFQPVEVTQRKAEVKRHCFDEAVLVKVWYSRCIK